MTRHTERTWRSLSASQKSDLGFHDLRPMNARAETCVECHVGPFKSPETQVVFDVTHELIAAGHPRLEFEFSAYLYNLPSHWDKAKDLKHNGGAAFQFHAWRVGQLQMAQQLAAQLADRRVGSATNKSRQTLWPEFANYNCFDCHHTLRHEARPSADRVARLISVRGRPEPSDWPFAQLQIIAWVSEDAALHALDQPLEMARGRLAFIARESSANQRSFFTELHQTLVKAAAATTLVPSDTHSVQILEDLLTEIIAGRATSYERVVQFQLALAAFVADYDQGKAKPSVIGDLSEKLEKYLDEECFSNPPGRSIYHSPDLFQYNAPDLRAQLQTIAAELATIRVNEPAAKK